MKKEVTSLQNYIKLLTSGNALCKNVVNDKVHTDHGWNDKIRYTVNREEINAMKKLKW